MTDIFDLPVFPAAEIFPMLPDDELEELAEDIKANGLREPLVLAKVGKVEVLVDGRNRRAACKIAGVEPTTRRLNGEDPTAFVLSANIHRRHLTKGQRAMAVAMLYPESGERGRGKKSASTKSEIISGFSERYVQKARVILCHSRDLAQTVLAGAIPLNDAHQEALAAKKAADSDEARLVTMRAEAPELADLVVEERLKLGEAWIAFEERQRATAAAEANQREVGLRLAETTYRGAVAWASAEFVERFRSWLEDDEFHTAFQKRMRLVRDDVEAISAGAEQLLALLTEELDDE